MASAWLEIEAQGTTSRVELRPGLTRLGAAGADVALPAAPRGELHVWDDPPKVVYLGAGEPPRLGGTGIEERALRPGDRIEWGAVTIRYCEPLTAPPPVLEELPLGAPFSPTTTTTSGAAPSAASERAASRVRAGMLLELGLVDRKAARRWQDAVLRGEYDPDACARELLAGTSIAPDDPRLVERSGRLLRDFLMTPLASGARGAARRVRGAAKRGAAFVLVQAVVILVYTGILVTMMVIARLKWGWSYDAFFDRILGR